MISVAFDCDDTLVTDNAEETPLSNAITLFRILANLGCEMFIWSRQGVAHAAQVRDKLRLSASVVEKGSFMPHIAVDDEERLGLVNITPQGVKFST